MSAEDGEGENPYRPRHVGPPGPGNKTKPPSPPAVQQPSPDEPERPAESPPKRKGHKVDYLVGIPLGLLLGVGIVTAFVFLGSEGTIDAPRIKNPGTTGVAGETGATGASGPSRSASSTPSAAPSPKPPSAPAKLPVIRIVGSKPPLAAGPVKIEAKRGKPVRFRVESDGAVSIKILGTGFTKEVSSGDTVTFTPEKAGQFPTFVSGKDVNVATFKVSP